MHTSTTATVTETTAIDHGRVPCPTCKQHGANPCIRGRYPSAIWMRGEILPAPHDSRVAANREPRTGDRVKVVNSMLYTGRHGTIEPASSHPEDFWDWNVRLDDDGQFEGGELIGVTRDQIVRI